MYINQVLLFAIAAPRFSFNFHILANDLLLADDWIYNWGYLFCMHFVLVFHLLCYFILLFCSFDISMLSCVWSFCLFPWKISVLPSFLNILFLFCSYWDLNLILPMLITPTFNHLESGFIGLKGFYRLCWLLLLVFTGVVSFWHFLRNTYPFTDCQCGGSEA